MGLVIGLVALALGITLVIVGVRGTQAQVFAALTGHGGTGGTTPKTASTSTSSAAVTANYPLFAP